MTSSPGRPWSACSSGIVTSDSISDVESPTEAVWISTRGGANSGKTSTGMSRTWPMPKNISAAAMPSTMKRNRRLKPTIRRIMVSALQRPRSSPAGPQ